MKLDNIDNGNTFDWGKTSADYARFRDIYPQEFYDMILARGACKDGQTVLDIGSGTGVLPRNMYRYGAKWIGTDISENQIAQAKRLAEEAKMDIRFFTASAEEVDLPESSLDVITAAQCIWYPDHSITAPKFNRMLKKGGRFLILYMAWLPFEDDIAGKSEEIILRYNPDWTGAGETRKPVWVPEDYLEYFDITYREERDVNVPFTRETWHGRMRACRGVGAAMDESTLAMWEKDHSEMLMTCPERFEIKHYISIAELTKK